ncbi:hypothetical protein ACFSKL_10620, partial [Belliella marina]
KNVLFDNVHDQNAFHLFGDVSIAGVSRFVQGIVLADGNGGLMLFEKGGSHTQTSDLSHVDGVVAKKGDEAFVYPIGDGGFFRFAGISSPSETISNFHAKYFFE